VYLVDPADREYYGSHCLLVPRQDVEFLPSGPSLGSTL
jgi:hypothetical protein